MEPIGVGKRAVAVIIDSLLLGVIGFALAMMTGGRTGTGFELEGGPFFLFLALSLGYFIVMEKTSGATIGKKVMHIRVVRQDGQPMDWSAAVIRNLLRIIDGQLIYLVGALVVWFSRSKQRLGDMAAKTIVVSNRDR